VETCFANTKRFALGRPGLKPPPSSRHHLSYDDCLRKNYQNCSVLSCVQQLCIMICTHEQFLKMSVGLGLIFVHLFRFSILCVFWFNLDYSDLVLFAFVVLGLVSLLRQQIG